MSTNETWTPADERAFNEMAERRQRILGERRAAVQAVAMTFDGESSMASEIADWLIHHADSVRDALKSYDSGVRVAESPKEVWIKWDGGELPVRRGTDVHVRYRDGDLRIGRAGEAYMTRWAHKGASDDIVAYRVLP